MNKIYKNLKKWIWTRGAMRTGVYGGACRGREESVGGGRGV